MICRRKGHSRDPAALRPSCETSTSPDGWLEKVQLRSRALVIQARSGRQMYLRARTCPTQSVDQQSFSCPLSSKSTLALLRIMMSRSYTPERFTSAAFRDLHLPKIQDMYCDVLLLSGSFIRLAPSPLSSQ